MNERQPVPNALEDIQKQFDAMQESGELDANRLRQLIEAADNLSYSRQGAGKLRDQMQVALNRAKE